MLLAVLLMLHLTSLELGVVIRWSRTREKCREHLNGPCVALRDLSKWDATLVEHTSGFVFVLVTGYRSAMNISGHYI